MNDLLKAKKIFRRLSIMLFASIIMMLFLCSCRTINMVDSAETVLNGSLNIKELEDTTNPEKQVAIVKENNEFGTTQEKKIETTISPDSRLLYVLQNAGIYELFAADFDVAVVDPDDSGMKGIEVDTLKRQDKEIIAYISIGEAEDYRSYWKSDWKPGNPVFLDQENEFWRGNYRVKFWMEQWQQIVFTRINEVIDNGYSGVYLDKVDVYLQYQTAGFNSAADEMLELVTEISQMAKSRSEDFLIIPQNAEELTIYPAYIDAIDGVGKESLWFYGEKRGDKAATDSSLFYLSRLDELGKFVFVISYVEKIANQKEFLDLAKSHGFIPYIGRLELDTIEDICNPDI